MRRQEVQPGNVYAYREGTYGLLKKAVVLTPIAKDTLYTTARWKQENGFIRDTHRSSPAQYKGYTPASGWLMAIGPNPVGATIQEALEYGKQVGEDGLLVEWSKVDYEYKLITSMAYLHGDYDQIMQANAIEQAANAERSRIRSETNKAESEAFLSIRDSFRRQLDGVVNLMSGGSLWEPNFSRPGISAPTHLTLDREAAEQLVSLLSAKEDLIHSLRAAYQILADENDMLCGQLP